MWHALRRKPLVPLVQREALPLRVLKDRSRHSTAPPHSAPTLLLLLLQRRRWRQRSLGEAAAATSESPPSCVVPVSVVALAATTVVQLSCGHIRVACAAAGRNVRRAAPPHPRLQVGYVAGAEVIVPQVAALIWRPMARGPRVDPALAAALRLRRESRLFRTLLCVLALCRR